MLWRTLKNVPGRFRRASGFSARGLKAAFLGEESFRLEILGLALLGAVLLAVPWPLWKKAALAAAYLLIPATELLNSALEDLADLVSPDFHPLVEKAKNKGSAAVLLAIVANIICLGALILA